MAKARKISGEPALIRIVRWMFPKLEIVAPFVSDWIFRSAFVIPARYKTPPKELIAAGEAELSRMEVGHRFIQIYSWGEKRSPYVLVAHGWAGRATQFSRFIKPLNNAGYRVIGFDGPAHGNSDGTKTSMKEFEDCFRKIFQTFGEPRAIITHSFGGAAILYAGSHGLKYSTLINIATPYVEEEILDTYRRALNASPRSVEKFRRFVIKSEGHPFSEFTGVHTINRLQHSMRFMIVQDDDDVEVPVANAEALLTVYPAAVIFRTKGLGHTRVLKDEKVIKACIDFINDGQTLQAQESSK